MNVLLVVVILLFFLLLYILWAPIILYVDTAVNKYYVQIKGLVRADVLEDKKEVLRIRLRILFMRFSFYPLRTKPSKKRRKKEVGKKESRRRMSWSVIKRILRSFRVKKLYVNVDTGDYVLNAKLIPLCTLLNLTGGAFRINFQDSNHLVLHLQNRSINIVRAFINL